MLELVGFRGQLNIEVRHVQLKPVGDYGMMRWHVAVQAYELTGEHDEIYIWPTNYERFLQEITRLEQYRQGTALLTSTGQVQLQLKFRSVDKLGHTIVEGQLGDYSYVGDGFFLQNINFAFEFDPTLLPGLVRQFTAFKTW